MTEEVKKEEVKKEEIKKEVSDNDESGLFVTENDIFDVIIKYYKNNNDIFVEGVDDNFEAGKCNKQFTMTFKYPSQADVSRIAQQGIKLKISSEEMDLREIMGLEFSRVLCLMRKWTLKEKLSVDNLMKLHPKIVKAIILQTRIKLGMDGII